MIVTPSQTVGPFFKIGLCCTGAPGMTIPAGAEFVSVVGTVYDAEGKPVVDALIEVWQADREYFARAESAPDDGSFYLSVIRPTSLREANGVQHAPHLVVGIFARGLLKRLYTRIYFADEPLNATDPILALVPPARRATLIATPTAVPRDFRLDIRLSGPGETVFFDC